MRPVLSVKALTVFVIVALFLPLNIARAAEPSLVFKVASGRILSMKDLMKDLEETDILTVGERHDNPHHHQVQLAVIRALHEADVKMAIGFEMFSSQSQDALDRWVSGKGSEDDLFDAYARDWDVNWYLLYRDIFLYAREHRLPMVGLNVERGIVTQVARRGFASLSEEQRGKIRVLSCSIDQEYKEVLARVLGQKGAGGQVFDRFCEAQVVWDTSMALNAIDFLAGSPGTKMVIVAGIFHAWNRGIPDQVSAQSGFKARAMVPAADTGFFDYEVVTDEADYVWWEK